MNDALLPLNLSFNKDGILELAQKLNGITTNFAIINILTIGHLVEILEIQLNI